MGLKNNSKGNNPSKTVSQKDKMMEEDLYMEVSNISEQEVDETAVESYCPFDLIESGEIKEAIYGSYTSAALQELLKENEKELGVTDEKVIGKDVIEEKVIGTDERKRVQAPYNKFPYTAICKLSMVAQNGKRYIGTGFFVGPRVVLTAGHCVYMHKEGGWAKSIEVFPALDDSTKKYGSVVCTQFHSLAGWTKKKESGYDFGAIILPENAALGNRTGWFGYGYNSQDKYFNKLPINISGYPGDKGGYQQWEMSGECISVISDGKQLAYQIDTYGGQSGSPVWEVKNNSVYVKGIHTSGDDYTNYATRIQKYLFDLINKYKEDYPAK